MLESNTGKHIHAYRALEVNLGWGDTHSMHLTTDSSHREHKVFSIILLTTHTHLNSYSLQTQSLRRVPVQLFMYYY